VIDVDLQDQPELIADLYRKLQEGYEVVYAQRRSRKGETAVKRLISYLGYATINRLSDVPIPRNTGDFRIMTRRVVEELRQRIARVPARICLCRIQAALHRIAVTSGSRQGNYSRLTGSLIGLN
jgi:dolichol-phosphate mannosyltransferase